MRRMLFWVAVFVAGAVVGSAVTARLNAKLTPPRTLDPKLARQVVVVYPGPDGYVPVTLDVYMILTDDGAVYDAGHAYRREHPGAWTIQLKPSTDQAAAGRVQILGVPVAEEAAAAPE